VDDGSAHPNPDQAVLGKNHGRAPQGPVRICDAARVAGTREDAALIVELAKWGSMIGLPEASRTIFSDDFDSESAEALDPQVQTVLVFHETVGTLVKNDLLDRDLVLDWLWVSGAWVRVEKAALEARAQAGEPRLWENFEALAQDQG